MPIAVLLLSICALLAGASAYGVPPLAEILEMERKMNAQKLH
jgi:hypothetical protein